MKQVAMIEDNPDNRLLVRAMLEDHFALVEYENGMEGLAGMRESRPDLLLLDISLPVMDGPSILKEIRADSGLRGLPVIALTAHAMQGVQEKYLGMGFDEYVSKPIVDEEILIGLIRKHLS